MKFKFVAEDPEEFGHYVSRELVEINGLPLRFVLYWTVNNHEGTFMVASVMAVPPPSSVAGRILESVAKSGAHCEASDYRDGVDSPWWHDVAHEGLGPEIRSSVFRVNQSSSHASINISRAAYLNHEAPEIIVDHFERLGDSMIESALKFIQMDSYEHPHPWTRQLLSKGAVFNDTRDGILIRNKEDIPSVNQVPNAKIEALPSAVIDTYCMSDEDFTSTIEDVAMHHEEIRVACLGYTERDRVEKVGVWH